MPLPEGQADDLLGPFEYRFPATARGARLARQVLGLWLDQQPIPDDCVHDLLLACSELCGNAIRHGAPTADGMVALAASIVGSGVAIEVHDDGSGFTLQGRRTDPEAEGGRGLQLVSQVTDHVDVRMEPDHTVVRCYKADALDLR